MQEQCGLKRRSGNCFPIVAALFGAGGAAADVDGPDHCPGRWRTELTWGSLNAPPNRSETRAPGNAYHGLRARARQRSPMRATPARAYRAILGGIVWGGGAPVNPLCSRALRVAVANSPSATTTATDCFHSLRDTVLGRWLLGALRKLAGRSAVGRPRESN